MQICIVLSAKAGETREWALEMPAGSTLAQALAQLNWDSVWSVSGPPSTPAFSVWGRRADPGQVLLDADRIEITRELRVDPKVARRERFKQQGQRSAGLFARRKT
jgi:putative ubiquitin-RnfH superfamily antitoxin RatB of RatAB toxin-antitoxin module